MFRYLQPRDPYDILIRKMGYPASQTLRRIYELSCTREEADVLVELPAPAEEIARKLNRDMKAVEVQLDRMLQVGLVRHGKTADGKAQFKRDSAIETLSDAMLFIVGRNNLDRSPDATLYGKTLKDEREIEITGLWQKFFYEEWYRWERPDTLVHRRVTILGGADRGRTLGIMPTWKALEKSAALGVEILPEWDLREIARRAEALGVYVRACTCRTRARTCDAPTWTCGARFEGMPGLAPGVGPADSDKLGLLHRFSAEEWLEQMGTVEEDRAMVHMGGPWRKSCTCCTDCCNWLVPLRLYTEPWEGVHPSPYRAVVNQDVCEGCVNNCIPRCHFRVLDRQKDPSSGKVTAFADLEKCVGCGQCVIGCPVEGAVKLELAEDMGAPTNPFDARLKLPAMVRLPRSLQPSARL